MSIQSMMSQHSVTIQAPANTQDRTGAIVRGPYTTQQAGFVCTIQDLSAAEQTKYLRDGITATHQMFSQTNPGVTVGHRVLFDGQYLEVTGCIRPGNGANPRLDHWQTFLKQISQRQSA